MEFANEILDFLEKGKPEKNTQKTLDSFVWHYLIIHQMHTDM